MERWYVELTIEELHEVERALGLDTADSVAKSAASKVRAVLRTAEHWDTPEHETPSTPSRGAAKDG